MLTNLYPVALSFGSPRLRWFEPPMHVDTLLIDPDAFFERERTNTRLLGPSAVVTGAAITSVLSTLVVMLRFSTSLPSDQSMIVRVSLTLGMIVGFFSVYVGWAVLSAATYVLATRIFDATIPDFRTLFRLIGWGFVPAIPAGLVSSVASYLVYYRVDVPSDPQALNALVASLAGHPLFTVSRFTVVVFTLWQGFLWTFAIMHAADLDLREGALVAGFPTGAILLVQVLSA